MATYGLLAILVVMLLKEVGVPVPIPSDLIMITAGVQAATGNYSLLALLLAIGCTTLLGGSIQCWIARSAGREFIYRIGRFIGLTRERLDRAMGLLQRRGAVAVFLGLNVPGARAGITPAAGLARLPYPIFAPAMLAGSGIFYGWHVALGYLVGPSATSLLEGLHLPLAPVVAGLAVLGLLGWLFLRWRKRRQVETGLPPEYSTLDRLHSWTEAACPACLAITLIQQNMSKE
ncbi:MAG: DedA family protein [Chloroflexi bacterium]|nr:DedA family protein [Chloroflexota bacterium]